MLDEKRIWHLIWNRIYKGRNKKLYVKILGGCFVHSGSLSRSQSNRPVSRMKRSVTFLAPSCEKSNSKILPDQRQNQYRSIYIAQKWPSLHSNHLNLDIRAKFYHWLIQEVYRGKMGRLGVNRFVGCWKKGDPEPTTQHFSPFFPI